ncbi:hypothetical protein [uncultured Roseobacter sp.]|uniref:hypothetical protein n=1 Tax=uncultured Roseobacter sp. TaxID=114847 RepID=UPI002616E1DE|nr:hypothetical protein [uncultured Roseobacter sp.]
MNSISGVTELAPVYSFLGTPRIGQKSGPKIAWCGDCFKMGFNENVYPASSE